jgi:FAD:protein FMN transferase
MNRRAFLDPRHLATQAGQVVGLAHELHQSHTVAIDQELTLVRYARPAMGTVFEIVLPFGHGLPSSFIHDAFDRLDEIESWMTIYRAESEVSEVNRRAASEAVSVSDDLAALLRLSLQVSEWTNGAFDAAAGALVQAWGFVRGPRQVPTEEARLAAISCTGSRFVELSTDNTIRFHRPGVVLNFGSIGKGYALDQLAAWFAEHAPEQPVLLHGGKSSIIARGTPPGHPLGWSVSIDHPWNPEAKLATLYLRDEAIATSAATFKHLVHEGKKLGHILDPRTGWPAAGIASATLRSSSAALADALSTACYIQGADWTRQFVEHQRRGEAILLTEQGHLLEFRL